MSKRNWTKEQAWAIQDRGGTLLLSAAAGSGKTAVLTQRAVELICDENSPTNADNLLIVTFTNAAAAELRQRMAAALEEKCRADRQNAYLKRQKLLLQHADICTVDTFCINLLTSHFNESDISGDFTILHAAQETQLWEDALNETLEEAYQNPAYRAFVSMYGHARDDTESASVIYSLYKITRTMADPEGYLATLAQEYAVSSSPADTRWGKLLLHHAELLLESVEARLQTALELTQEEEPLQAYCTVLEEDLELARRLRMAVRKSDWDSCCELSRRMSFSKMPSVSQKKCTGPSRGRITELRKGCVSLLRTLPEDCFVADCKEFAAEQAICRPMVEALALACHRFSEILFEKKQNEKAFSFDDFEHQALKLLQDENGNKTPLAVELSEKYTTVMVDEYQDTNDLQSRLYQMLANADQSNLFFVGDVKQSIYGFRDARPDCFISKRESYAPYDGHQYPAFILLGHNFRSTPGVIGAVNDVFSRVMRREAGGVDYHAEEYLVPGLEAEQYAISPPAEIWLADTAPDEDAQSIPGTPKPDDSAMVARHICTMLREGVPVRADGGTRPCRPGDFCILLRSPARAGKNYVEKLEALGIGAFCCADDELTSAPEVQLLLSFLRILDNPGQDIHLAAVLLSPLFGFVPDDLAVLRAQHRKGTLYAALLQSDNPKIVAFLEQLRTLRRRAMGLPVQDICAMLLDETGFYHLAGAFIGGESCQQNLRAFQACSAEYAGVGGVAGFLRMVDTAIKKNRPLSAARHYSAPEDKVQLMSIHGAKGLEFPIVILANASRQFNGEDARANFLCHGTLGVAFRLQREGQRVLVPTLAYRAVLGQKKLEQAGEELRLLYVALTRAKDRLIISWHDDRMLSSFSSQALDIFATGGPDLYSVLNTGNKGMSRWLMQVMLTHPDFDAVRRKIGWEDLSLGKKQGSFTCLWEMQETSEPEQERVPDFEAAPDEELAARLVQSFTVGYPAPAEIPVKVSVSALSKHSDTPVLGKPAFLYREGMTAAQRGTALHTFLQSADLRAARQNVQSEIQRMVAGGFLEEQAAAQMNMAQLNLFLDSPLFERMCAAEQLLREYEFISRIPASLLPQATEGDTSTVFLLGIADCVLLNGREAELVDYKTDRGKTEEDFRTAYTAQLALYKDAIEKRLQVRVTRSEIYSFELGREIPVRL